MTKKGTKRLAVAAAAMVILAAGVGAALIYAVTRSPERVAAAIERQVSESLDIPVTVKGARFEWKAGPRVILTGVHMEEPGAITLDIPSITAYLSTLRLLLGEARVVKVRLVTPKGSVDAENLERLLSRHPSRTRPVVIVWKGSVKLVVHGVDLHLADLSGRITNDWLNLRCRTMGGRILLETDLNGPGRTTFDAYGVDLSEIDSALGGVAYVNLTMKDSSKDGSRGSVSVKVKGLRAPFLQKAVESLMITSSLSWDGRTMAIQDIALKTPVVSAGAMARLTLPAAGRPWEDAALELEGASGWFSYEELVSYLPLTSFPEWLATLLGRQIRDGRSRFSSARFQGTLGDLFSGAGVLDRIRVVQVLDGQSFSAGRTADRITGITGSVVYASGDIRFAGLKGWMGSSPIGRVDIVFPGALRPKMRVNVAVDLDMPASDFIRSWHAAITDDKLHSLLGDVAGVKKGNVSCSLVFAYDEERKDPLWVKGRARIDGCSFTWGAHAVSDATGTMEAKRFGDRQETTARLTVDGVRIRRLSLSTWSPFGRSLARYSLEIDRLPRSGDMVLDNVLVRMTGSGRGLDSSGRFVLDAGSMRVRTDGAAVHTDAVSATGRFTLGLKDELHLAVSDASLRIASDTLDAAADLRGPALDVRLSGRLNLKTIVLAQSDGERRLSGTANGWMRYVNGKQDTGLWAEVRLADAGLPLAGSSAVLSGVVTVRPGRASLRKVSVVVDGTRVVLDGDLATGTSPMLYTGTADVAGLAIGGRDNKEKALQLPSDLEARLDLRLTDCLVRGLKIDTASSRAKLADGVLRLDEVEGRAFGGHLKGKAAVGTGGRGTVEASVSLTEADLRRILEATVGSSSADGRVDLKADVAGDALAVNGRVALSAGPGEIRKYALVSRIFSLLNVYRLVKHPDLEVLSRRFTYNRIKVTLIIKGPKISFDDFTLESDSIQVSAVGTYDVETREIDAIVGVQPLESLDRTIAMIPVVGWVFTGDEGRFVVVSMRVKGNMDDPGVTPAPVETLSNTIVASLLRSLRLPARIVEKSVKAIEGAPGR